LTEPLIKWAGKYTDVSNLNLQSELIRWLKNISQPLLSFGPRALSNIFVLLTNTVVVFFTLFYLFREGKSMREHLGAMLPLSSNQFERLVTGIDNSIIANVHGCIAVAVAQGALTGLAFWALGLPLPVLWAVVTGLFSMVPVIGSGAVWGPAVIILAVNGHWWKAVALLIWGAVVIAQSDTVVRPYIISKRSAMHPLLLFFALLGGVAAFGFLGLFIGPVVLSITIVVFQMLKEANLSILKSPAPLLQKDA
jgi:predicted PurR-regulated permease PerM